MVKCRSYLINRDLKELDQVFKLSWFLEILRHWMQASISRDVDANNHSSNLIKAFWSVWSKKATNGTIGFRNVWHVRKHFLPSAFFASSASRLDQLLPSNRRQKRFIFLFSRTNFKIFGNFFQPQFGQHWEPGHEGDVLQQVAEGSDRGEDSPSPLRKPIHAEEQGKKNYLVSFSGAAMADLLNLEAKYKWP